MQAPIVTTFTTLYPQNEDNYKDGVVLLRHVVVKVGNVTSM